MYKYYDDCLLMVMVKMMMVKFEIDACDDVVMVMVKMVWRTPWIVVVMYVCVGNLALPTHTYITTTIPYYTV